MMGLRLADGITIARANWRAVWGSTPAITAPSRKWTCQSSGRRMVRRVAVLVMPRAYRSAPRDDSLSSPLGGSSNPFDG